MCAGRTLIAFSFCLALLAEPGVAAAEPAESAFRTAHSDFFRVFYPDRTDIDLYYRYEPKGEAKDGPGEYKLHLYGIEGELPLASSRDTFIRAGAVYDLRSYDFDDVPGSQIDSGSTSLHRLAATIGIGTFLSDSLLFSAAATPGVYTDFSDPADREAFDLKGEALFVLRINPGAQLLLGAARTNVDSDHTILPLLGLRLLSEDGRLNISLTFPHELRIGYALSPQLHLYGGGWAYGDEYRAEIDDEELDITIEERRLGIGLQWYISRHFSLLVEGGALVDSTLELDTNLAAPFEDGKLEPSPYIGAALGFAL